MSFFEEVYKVASEIPEGKVATYSQVAAIVGSPRGAQAVGWALRALPSDTTVPWQRIVNAQGRISIQNMKFPQSLQAELLKAEGIPVSYHDDAYWVELEANLWEDARLQIK